MSFSLFFHENTFLVFEMTSSFEFVYIYSYNGASMSVPLSVVDTLVTNQARQPPVPQEAASSGGDLIVAPAAPVVAADTGT